MKTINKSAVITGLIALVIGVGIGVVGTVAKAGSSRTEQTETAVTNQVAASPSSNSGSAGQSLDPFREIQDMQAQMDNLFNQISSHVPSESQSQEIGYNPGYSLSLNLQDLKDRFVVHAFLPDTKDSDVNVKLENNHTLNVNVSSQQEQTSDKHNLATSVAEWGHYEQVIQLPSSVKSDRMKVVREPHELIITLPKA
jgi:HSP20 family molecular chaperone IbpA